MSENRIEKTDQDINFIEETYNNVAKNSSVILKTFEWADEKDSFEIFSLYYDKTPVVSSSSTIVVQM